MSKLPKPKDKYSRMYFKYYNDVCARIKLLEERIEKIEKLIFQASEVHKCV